MISDQIIKDVFIDRRYSIAPQLYDYLRHWIVDRSLVPGELISEGEMARRLGVSRTPLRAALQQLAGEGLVNILPQVGSVVTEFDQGRLQEALFIREALEGAVVAKLATDQPDLSPLRKILALQKATAEIDDYASFFTYDEEFHHLLAKLAETPNSWRLVHSVKGHVDRQRYSMMSGLPGRSQRAYEEHLAIVAAIEAGDPEAASQAMIKHVNSVLELDVNHATKNLSQSTNGVQHN